MRTKIFGFIIGLLISLSALAQDNHNYLTPKGVSLYYKEVQNADRFILNMNEINPVPENMDGMCVTFSLRTDLSLANSNLKLISLTVGSENSSFMDVFYNRGTLTFRRKHDSGSPYYYDYNLFDPLFIIGAGSVAQGVSNWEVRLFFTGVFFWIETRDMRLPLNNKCHSPIFFGVNLPNRDFMDQYLRRQADAKIVFGDPNPPTVFSMPNEITIEAFNYADLKNELQKNFCDNNE